MASEVNVKVETVKDGVVSGSSDSGLVISLLPQAVSNGNSKRRNSTEQQTLHKRVVGKIAGDGTAEYIEANTFPQLFARSIQAHKRQRKNKEEEEDKSKQSIAPQEWPFQYGKHKLFHLCWNELPANHPNLTLKMAS